MFSLNPLFSKQSQIDLVLSSDIKLSKTELIQIKNKIQEENIVAPCWIHIGDKMYLWAETKLNTTFRSDTKKWRTMITSALVAVFGKWVYDILG